MNINLKAKLKRIRLFTIPLRFFRVVFTYIFPKISLIFKWAIASKELHSFTYNLTPFNSEYLLQNISIVCNLPYSQIEVYYNEINNNEKLKQWIAGKIENSEYRFFKDQKVELGNRFLHYCLVRANKPIVVVESGIEIGYTSILLCEALLKNIEEGFSGIYYGLDIDPKAGYLIQDKKYAEITKILVGDSLKSISEFESIDYYFSDGERTYEYEKVEFELLKTKVSSTGIIVSNKSNISNCTSTFAREMNRKHLYFREDPLNHWYPGTHFGIVY